MDHSSLLHCLAQSVSSQQILRNSSISCATFLEESVSHLLQFSTQADLLPLSLIISLIHMIKLQSLRFAFSMSLLQGTSELFLFPTSTLHVRFRSSFLSCAFSLNGQFSLLLEEIMPVRRGSHTVKISISLLPQHRLFNTCNEIVASHLFPDAG